MTGPMAKGCYCGTCATSRGTAPRPVVADPVAFRHGAIKHRMLTRIGSTEVDGSRPLNALGTRDDDDPAIALIDAFAGSMHILAWNVARLADDATIRRTEDRDALVDLTRLLGYEPRPALAATTTTLGLPRGAALSLFVVGRTVGWIAHAIEQYQNGVLIRPRARYTGVRPEPEESHG